ncbi:NAD(P)/FAD-dependent oxidoreductase [Kordiimonas laminariae]|uniref:NAD(P)/FAD-dependent oxidoreductase n=1 Tax=Kordiimonas laminariae TaxID=2917717 RepID=UPI001FF6A9B4|nr:FAD-dependent oxidoreductase [Kordiimonas laminariae]MCK0070880.1 FAD-dependent oxidoreductase [Kordiimonas laminariae]
MESEQSHETQKGVGNRIAVVGSGISGLSAAWHLARSHDVTLYEANDYLGGHTHTVEITVDGVKFPVDTGFIVFNPQNYPNLTAFFDHLGIETRETDMSFSASIDDGNFEYAGGDGGGLLAQPSNVLLPKFWSMISGILKFYRRSDRYAEDSAFNDLTLGELLEREKYSKAFIEGHLAPMGAAIWSSDNSNILKYPAKSFLKFFNNHGLTRITNRPVWRTVVNGSVSYVRAIEKKLSGISDIRLNAGVEKVTSEGGKVCVFSQGKSEIFDQVVLACHSDQARNLLKGFDHFQDLLRPLRYSENTVVLHSDLSLMPKRKKAWASWNYIGRTGAHTQRPAISYWMNQLQDLPVKTPVIVTLNPDRPIDPDLTYGTFEYDHPVFDQAALAAKGDVWSSQGHDNIWLAGAYLGDGFHEDGIQSGLAVAEMISGCRRPWSCKDQNKRIGLPNLIPLHEEAT